MDTLERLRELGNTVVVVEHDEAVMRAADFIVDLGPGAGENGGQVVATGTIDDVMENPNSITGDYLSGRRTIPVPPRRRHANKRRLVIKGAEENNLKGVDVRIPLGLLVCVSGVSGSGKSTLVNEVLYKKLAQVFYRGKDRPGRHKTILGLDEIDKVVNIDQSPIGRTPRSNPATYTGTFTPIRTLFSNLPEARVRGYAPGRFSFNVRGGRCEACQGEGYNQIEMQFLPDVTVPCEVCKGKRYNREALEVTFREKSIADVLDMTVDQALELFWNFPKIRGQAGDGAGRGPGGTSAWASRPPPCRGERPRGSSCPRSSPAGRRGRHCTSWTSPPPASPSRTAPPCSGCCTGWWTRATRWSSSSTTWT